MRPRWKSIHKIVLRGIIPVLKRLPYQTADAVLGLIGRLDLLVVPGQAKMYERKVAEAAEKLGCDWNPAEVTRKLAVQTYRWRARDLLLDPMSDERVETLFTVAGREFLDDAMSRGRGAILLANHFGSHVLMSHWLFRHGYPLRWFSERPRSVSEFMDRKFRAEGAVEQDKLFISRKSTKAEAAATILRATKALKSGMILKVASDVRWSDSHATVARFLGETSRYTSTWVTLAALTNAPVISAFCRIDETGRYRLEFREAFEVPADVIKNGRTAWWVQSALNTIEDMVRKYPDQSNDYFFWDVEEETESAA